MCKSRLEQSISEETSEKNIPPFLYAFNCGCNDYLHEVCLTSLTWNCKLMLSFFFSKLLCLLVRIFYHRHRDRTLTMALYLLTAKIFSVALNPLKHTSTPVLVILCCHCWWFKSCLLLEVKVSLISKLLYFTPHKALVTIRSII